MAYNGQAIPISFGALGLVTDLPASDIPPGALIRAWNVSVNEGYIQKAPGTNKYNTVALPAGVVAFYDWHPGIATQRMIAACENGNIYRDDGGRGFNSNTAVKTGLVGLTPNSQFIEGGNESTGRNRKLFFISFGQNQVQVLAADGVTFTTIASPALDWTSSNYPRCGVVHRNRFWVFSGQYVYGSDTANHENFLSNFLAQGIFPGEGGDIRGAYVYKGRMFAFKDGGFTYFLDDTDLDSENWFWRRLSSAFGLAAPNAICEALDDMLAGNSTGTITSYAATQAFGDIAAADVLQLAAVENYLRGNTSKLGISVEHMLYYPEKKQVFLTYRSAYYTYNDMMIVLDVNKTGQTPRITLWRKGSPQCLGLRKDINDIQRPMYGDKDGFIHLMDYEDRREGSTAYIGDFQTPHYDFSFADPSLRMKNKLFDWLSVTYEREGPHNLSCDYYIDGKYIDTINFPMLQYTDPQLDVLLLDVGRLAQHNTETSAPIRLTGHGRTISFRFYNSGDNESFRVAGIVVGLRPSGEQAQRT